MLSRKLANNNQYPAIDVLASVSRLMNDIVSPEHVKMANHIKNMMMTYNEVQDLVNIGAYKPGSDPKIDEAIHLRDPILGMLKQEIGEASTFEQSLEHMRAVLNSKEKAK